MTTNAQLVEHVYDRLEKWEPADLESLGCCAMPMLRRKAAANGTTRLSLPRRTMTPRLRARDSSISFLGEGDADSSVA